MKKKFTIIYYLVFISGFFAHQTYSQGYDDPLTVQGLDHNTLQSAASRGAGGILFGMGNNIGIMFSNPAVLSALNGPQVSIGGLQKYSDVKQTQHYAPIKYYSNFSLLMEGLTGIIPDPDTSRNGINAGDTVQRAFDNIGPNWSRSNDQILPLQGFAALPFTVGESKFAVGVGVAEYADLNHYYQNNNVLTPSILSERPIPISRPATDSTPIRTQWSQFSRSREGSINSYGIALSASVSEKIFLGISGMYLQGSTDDFERRVGRGNLTFFTNYFRLDSVFNRTTKTGTSDYSGEEITLSGTYRGKYVTVGFALKPSNTITRKYKTQIVVDTNNSRLITSVAEKDEILLPWRGTVGLSISVMDNVAFGLEYEMRPFESAIYTNANGIEINPWLSSSVIHVGLQYNPLSWLVLRGGIRGQAEVFEQQGNPIVGEPVSYSIYSIGGGISTAGVQLNLSYEYASKKYQDVWGSAISLNNEQLHTFVADIKYDIPWVW